MLQFLDRPGFLIVALLALVLFGAKRLPDSARALGRSMRILKAETKGMHDDGQPAVTVTATQLPVVASPEPTVQPIPQPVAQPITQPTAVPAGSETH